MICVDKIAIIGGRLKICINRLQVYSYKHDYSFPFVLLADKITLIGNKVSFSTSRCANVCNQIKLIPGGIIMNCAWTFVNSS